MAVLLNWSSAVTVTLMAPPAVALAAALTVKCVAAAALTLMAPLVPMIVLSPVSAAVIAARAGLGPRVVADRAYTRDLLRTSLSAAGGFGRCRRVLRYCALRLSAPLWAARGPTLTGESGIDAGT